MLTNEEKIQRAKEIYYRRNGIKYRGEIKKNRSGKKWMFLFLFIVLIVYVYQNRIMLFSVETGNQIKNLLNTRIDLTEYINRYKNSKQDVNNSTLQKEEIEENQIQNDENQEESNTTEVYSMIWPLKGMITSRFGKRESGDTRVGNNPTGIDIAGNER